MTDAGGDGPAGSKSAGLIKRRLPPCSLIVLHCFDAGGTVRHAVSHESNSGSTSVPDARVAGRPRSTVRLAAAECPSPWRPTMGYASMCRSEWPGRLAGTARPCPGLGRLSALRRMQPYPRRTRQSCAGESLAQHLDLDIAAAHPPNFRVSTFTYESSSATRSAYSFVVSALGPRDAGRVIRRRGRRRPQAEPQRRAPLQQRGEKFDPDVRTYRPRSPRSPCVGGWFVDCASQVSVAPHELVRVCGCAAWNGAL